MRLFFDGWTQDKAPLNPIMVFGSILAWWDLKRDSRRFQNETRAEFKQTRAEFNSGLTPLVTNMRLLTAEKNMRLLSAATAYLLPDRDPGRINCFCIHIFMPPGLPVLKKSQFVVDVDFSPLNPTGTQKLRVMYSNKPVGQKAWDLDIPEGLVVDVVELANTGWSFEVEDRRIARLTLRWPLITRGGTAGGSPPSTGPRPPETSAPPPPKLPAATARRISEGRAE